MSETVFERKEIKYMLTEEKKETFYERIHSFVLPDAYRQYTIGNVYYDTETSEMIRESIEGPVYKEKLRLRSYGVPKAEDIVFLEMKKKYDGIVYKRRVVLTLQAAEVYLSGGGHPGVSGQIYDELDYFLDFYKPEPKLYLAYDRAAFCGREDPELRITFDTGIRSRTTELRLGAGDYGEALLAPGQVLMELKVGNAMPLWLSGALSQEGLFPTSFSKYGSIYKQNQAAAT